MEEVEFGRVGVEKVEYLLGRVDWMGVGWGLCSQGVKFGMVSGTLTLFGHSRPHIGTFRAYGPVSSTIITI